MRTAERQVNKTIRLLCWPILAGIALLASLLVCIAAGIVKVVTKMEKKLT